MFWAAIRARDTHRQAVILDKIKLMYFGKAVFNGLLGFMLFNTQFPDAWKETEVHDSYLLTGIAHLVYYNERVCCPPGYKEWSRTK